MNKTAIPALLLLLLIGLIVASGCISAPPAQPPSATTPVPPLEKAHYTIGIDADYPPFTYQDDTGNFTGLDIEAALWIAERQGFEVGFVAVPWDGILDALRDGRIDMVYSGMTITPEREKEVAFTKPYFTVTKSVAVRSGSNVTLEDLNAGRLRVGAQAGSTGESWVKEHLVNTGILHPGQVFMYPDVPTLIDALVNESIDASISDTPTHQQAIAGKPLVILGEIAVTEQYAVAVRKDDTHLRAVMDEGLSQLMADPHWQELLERYGLHPLTSFSSGKPS
jgi:polar amino acid transport system substrate-binding protein